MDKSSAITPKRILGIDTGIAIMGWSILEKDSNGKLILIACGAITTSSKSIMGTRLLTLNTELAEIIKKYSPDIVAVESIFYFKNKKTIIAVSQARGVILMTAEQFGLEVVDYTPLQVKTAVTGYGRAEKQQVQKMVKLILGLKEVPKPDDVADAIAIGICYLNSKISAKKA